MLLASVNRLKLVCVIPMNEVHTQHARRAMLAYVSINVRLKWENVAIQFFGYYNNLSIFLKSNKNN